jgi:hypothetical protein
MKEMNIQYIYACTLLIFLSGFAGTVLLFHGIEKYGRHSLLSFGNNFISILWFLLSGIVYFKIYYFDEYYNPKVDFVTPESRTSYSYYLYEFLFVAIKFFYICFLCLFYCNYYLSWGSISWVYMAEIFPYRARAKAISITTSIHYFSALVASLVLSVVLQISDVINDHSANNNDNNTIIGNSTTTTTIITNDYYYDDAVSIANNTVSNITSTFFNNRSMPLYSSISLDSGLGAAKIGFSVLYTYLDLEYIAECFFLLGVFSLLVNVVIYLMIPETSGEFFLFAQLLL